MRHKVCLSCGIAAIAAVGIATNAHAITVSPTLDATTLETSLINAGSGLVVNTFTVSGHDDGVAMSAGTYTNASGTYGIGPGIVISSGDVADYGDGPNISDSNTTSFGVAATPGQEVLLDPITGGSFDHADVTQIDVNFDLLPGFDTVFFNVVWGSDEFDEFVGTTFIDAFGLYVNGTNIADVDGDPVNVDHPDMDFVAGTELDGILTNADGSPGPFVHTFSSFVGDGATDNTLTFIIADSGDTVLDSTAYISQLGATVPDDPADPGIPEPISAALGVMGLASLGLTVTRRRR